MVITTDTYIEQWFLNWRIARYYRPNMDFWVLYKKGENHGVDRRRRDLSVEKLENRSVRLPVPADCRIIWLIEPGGDLHKRLMSQYKLLGGRWVFYMDIAGESGPIQLEGVELVPTPLHRLSKSGAP